MSDYIRKAEAEALIASVTNWYEENGRRAAETKSKLEERRLAMRWRTLLRRKSKLPPDVCAEAEKLNARLQTVAGPVDDLVAPEDLIASVTRWYEENG